MAGIETIVCLILKDMGDYCRDIHYLKPRHLVSTCLRITIKITEVNSLITPRKDCSSLLSIKL